MQHWQHLSAQFARAWQGVPLPLHDTLALSQCVECYLVNYRKGLIASQALQGPTTPINSEKLDRVRQMMAAIRELFLQGVSDFQAYKVVLHPLAQQVSVASQ